MIRPKREVQIFFHSFHECLYAHFHIKNNTEIFFCYKIKLNTNTNNTILFIFTTTKRL